MDQIFVLIAIHKLMDAQACFSSLWATMLRSHVETMLNCFSNQFWTWIENVVVIVIVVVVVMLTKTVSRIELNALNHNVINRCRICKPYNFLNSARVSCCVINLFCNAKISSSALLRPALFHILTDRGRSQGVVSQILSQHSNSSSMEFG